MLGNLESGSLPLMRSNLITKNKKIMRKVIYFIPVGGFHALKSEFSTLKETLLNYGYKRSEISEWWTQDN